ncbi:MAG: hypothetical protein ACLRL3_00655 [Bifidobacterium adolescentis]
MSNINVQVAEVNDAFFNPRLADNPCVSRYNLRKADFANTMTDIYEFMERSECDERRTWVGAIRRYASASGTVQRSFKPS